VHERHRLEHDALHLLQAETKGIVILTEEQQAQIQLELAAEQKAENGLATYLDKIGKAIAWHLGMQTLHSEIATLAKEAEALGGEIEEFMPEREKLNLAGKAAELEGGFATLISTRKQQETDLKALAGDEAQLPRIEALILQKKELLHHAGQVKEKAGEERKAQAPLIQKVRILDQRILDKNKAINMCTEEWRNLSEQITGHGKAVARIKDTLAKTGKDLAEVQHYLQANARDQHLVTQLAGIEEQLGNLQTVLRDIAAKKVQLTDAEKQLQSSAKILTRRAAEVSARQQELAMARKQLDVQKGELQTLLGDRLLREYRAEKESLLREMAYLRKIAGLEAERKKLEDGKPCPLCGSKRHPFAEGNIPEADQTEQRIAALAGLIDKAEHCESRIKELEATEKQISAKVAATEKTAAEAVGAHANAEKSLNDITLELDRVTERFAVQKAAVLSRLQPFGVAEIPEGEVAAVLTSLQNRLEKWQEKQRRKEVMEKQGEQLQGEIQRLEAIIATQNQTLSEKQETLNGLKKEYQDHVAERQEMFGGKNPDEVEQHLEKSVSQAEQEEKTARQGWDEGSRRINAAKVRIAALQDRISLRTPELRTLEAEFVGDLNRRGFADEQLFAAARLPGPQRDRLMARAKKLDDKKADIEARRKDREVRLAREILKKITVSAVEELEPVRIELEESMKQVRDHVAELKYQLAADRTAKEKIREKQALIEAQVEECRRWDKLHFLIGSADGKKYRNFAQGLTFELMVSHANRQLAKMSDRYLLIRDEDQPLELNVIDNYQAGEIRSTRNLSGGESFIVSLSLALGLSKMAGRKVRVDSLFLDEGFGTLDEEALETALETLAGLHQDGKLIGIISHVPALRERIGTQITIRPLSGGKSIITGPGCGRVVDKMKDDVVDPEGAGHNFLN
jgi:exonuclease SbcC